MTDTKLPPLAIGTAVPAAASGDAKPSSAEGQKLARLAGEFESMLLLQMLREMRKSGSWKDEDEDKSGLGAETMFDTLDEQLASYMTKAQGFGLEKSLVTQVSGRTAGSGAVVAAQLPSLDLPVANPTPPGRRGSVDLPQDLLADRVETSAFGWRQDPFTGATKYHRGVDLRAAYGEPVGVAGQGTVVFAGEQRGYGQTVVVEHANGVRTRYAHLSSLMTATGAEVKAGEPIGRAGHSGRATGTHVHFEVTKDGHPVDPHNFPGGALKPERVTADWRVANGPTLPGVASEGHGSGAD